MTGPQGAILLEERIVPIHDLLNFPHLSGEPFERADPGTLERVGRDLV